MDTFPCLYCGNPTVRVTVRTKFCSETCRHSHYYAPRRAAVIANRPPRACPQCGKPIDPAKTGNIRFCAPAHAAKFNNRGRIEDRKRQSLERRLARGPCRRCGGPIPVTRRADAVFCSQECRQRAVTKRWLTRAPGYMRQRLYGITPEQYAAILAAQDGRCAICRTDTPNGKGWHVDHDHVTKRIRGILCHTCNLMLGHAGDDPARLRTAADYLAR